MARFVAKDNKPFFAIGSGLFLLVTFVTAAFQAASDGYDIIGFPVVFYSHTAGKCLQCTTYWNWTAFLADFGIYLLTSWLLIKAVRFALN
jgi:hypothetical protein